VHRQGWIIEDLAEAEIMGGQVRTSTEVEYTLTASSTENGSSVATYGNLPLQQIDNVQDMIKLKCNDRD
jgi:hypothetical protein